MKEDQRKFSMRTLVKPPARVKKDQVELSKSQIAVNVTTLYFHPDFPQEIYVALEDCILCGKGSVVFPSFEAETPFEFIPYARIDQLVTNIPSKEDYLKFFSDRYGIKSLKEITTEKNEGFWQEFEMEFADQVKNMKIIWK